MASRYFNIIDEDAFYKVVLQFQSLNGLPVLRPVALNYIRALDAVPFQSLNGLSVLQPVTANQAKQYTMEKFQFLNGLSVPQRLQPRSRGRAAGTISIPKWPFTTSTLQVPPAARYCLPSISIPKWPFLTSTTLKPVGLQPPTQFQFQSG